MWAERLFQTSGAWTENNRHPRTFMFPSCTRTIFFYLSGPFPREVGDTWLCPSLPYPHSCMVLLLLLLSVNIQISTVNRLTIVAWFEVWRMKRRRSNRGGGGGIQGYVSLAALCTELWRLLACVELVFRLVPLHNYVSSPCVPVHM